MAHAASEGVTKDVGKDDDVVSLGTLEDFFNDAEDETRAARQKSEQARDYYDNKQLTTAEIAILAARDQPPIVFNRIAPKVDFLLGFERQNRTDPKAYPRTPKHEGAADAATDAIRYVFDKEDFDVKSSDVFSNMLIEGTGGCSVEVVANGNEIEVVIKYIRWDRIFYDPYSMAHDFSDTRYNGVVIWKDLDVAKAQWGAAADDLQAQMDGIATGETYDDKPARFFNKDRNRVQCIDIWFKWKQKWHHAIFAKGVWLERVKLSTYLDSDGQPANPLILRSVKIKRNGERYGPVEALIDIQDEINKRRSKALHILNTKQTFGREGFIVEIDKFKKEAQKPDGHLEYPPEGEFGKDFGVIPNEGLVAPQLAMYQDAITQIDSVQANPALSGKTEGDLSGRAIQSLQQGGMVELAPLFDTHAQWKKNVALAVWDRIRQFKQEEWWIRVTDDEENLKYVGLNRPITLAAERIAEQMGISAIEVSDQFPEELAEIQRLMPELAEVLEVENEVAEIDVDIIVEEVPNVVNLQAEEFEQLVKIGGARPDVISNDLLIEMSSLRKRVKDRLTGRDPSPEQQQAFQAQQASEAEAQEIAKADAVAGIDAKTAKAARDRASADKSTAEADGVKFDNTTRRVGIKELLEFVER